MILTGQNEKGVPAFNSRLPEIKLSGEETEAMLQQLPAVQVGLAQVSAQQAGVKLSTREQRADPTIGVRIGREDSDTLTGLTFSMPLFVRNDFSAEVDVANASLIQAERNAANIWQQSRADLLAATQIYLNARQSWHYWLSSGEPYLRKRIELLDRLWQAAEINTTEYLLQLRQTLETEMNASRQRGRLWQAWADWLLASGQADTWLQLQGDES